MIATNRYGYVLFVGWSRSAVTIVCIMTVCTIATCSNRLQENDYSTWPVFHDWQMIIFCTDTAHILQNSAERG